MRWPATWHRMRCSWKSGTVTSCAKRPAWRPSTACQSMRAARPDGGPKAARAREAGLHLVAHEQRPRRAALRLRAREVARGRDVHALALDRLEHQRRDRRAFKRARQRVEVAEGNRIAAREQGLETA